MIHSNKIVGLALILFVALSHTACIKQFSPYAPIDAQLLAIDEKKDIKASLAYTSTDDPSESGVTAQLGYSPIQHLGIKSGFTYMQFDEERHINGAFAVGAYYFLEFGSKKKETLMPKGLLFSGYLGYSLGQKRSADEFFNEGTFQYNKFFFQPGFTVSVGVYAFDFGAQISMIDFTTATLHPALLDNFDVDYAINNDPHFVPEMSLRHRFGIRQGQLFIGTTFSPDTRIINETFTATVGFIIDIDDIARGKRKQLSE